MCAVYMLRLENGPVTCIMTISGSICGSTAAHKHLSTQLKAQPNTGMVSTSQHHNRSQIVYTLLMKATNKTSTIYARTIIPV